MRRNVGASAWVIPFLIMPVALASRSPLPLAAMIFVFLVFIAIWLLRMRNIESGDAPAKANRKAMGLDSFGVGLLAVMGACFVVLKVAMNYGGMPGYMVVMAGLFVTMVLALLIGSIISVRRSKWAAKQRPME